jgi:hypothetical protein
MTTSRLFAACVILLGIPLIASAGPGDPRLVNGVLEWPGVVTNEPFVIVRGDDGVLYYVGIAASRREGAVTAGARVSVLGIEGRSANEITAVGIGSGPSAEAALAQLQGARPSGPVAPVASAPAPAAAPTSEAAVVPTPPVTAPGARAGAAVAIASSPAAAPAPVATATATRPAAPVAPAPRRPGVPPPAAVTTDARASAAAGPVVMPASTTPPPKPAIEQPPTVATAPMLPVTDDHRWVELGGEVETLVGRTLVLKVDGGRVSVDVSSLSANLGRMVAPGSMVKVYGVPVELRFKAMGFIDPDAREPNR